MNPESEIVLHLRENRSAERAFSTPILEEVKNGNYLPS